MDAIRQAINMLEDQFAKGIEANPPDSKSVGPGYDHGTKEALGGDSFSIMAPTFVCAVKEPREPLAAELFIMEDPSKSKYWKETE